MQRCANTLDDVGFESPEKLKHLLTGDRRVGLGGVLMWPQSRWIWKESRYDEVKKGSELKWCSRGGN
jgi:hypothetical protein